MENAVSFCKERSHCEAHSRIFVSRQSEMNDCIDSGDWLLSLSPSERVGIGTL